MYTNAISCKNCFYLHELSFQLQEWSSLISRSRKFYGAPFRTSPEISFLSLLGSKSPVWQQSDYRPALEVSSCCKVDENDFGHNSYQLKSIVMSFLLPETSRHLWNAEHVSCRQCGNYSQAFERIIFCSPNKYHIDPCGVVNCLVNFSEHGPKIFKETLFFIFPVLFCTIYTVLALY
jgi:hypothetical protein